MSTFDQTLLAVGSQEQRLFQLESQMVSVSSFLSRTFPDVWSKQVVSLLDITPQESSAVGLAAIADRSIPGVKLVLQTVTADEIANSAITTAKILNDAVTELKLAALAVTEAKIAANAITETKIANDAITTPKLVAGAITSAKIAANTIQAGNIAANTITAAEIAALTITSGEIAANAIISTKIAANQIDVGHLTTTWLYAYEFQLATGGKIRSGQTAYDTGTGFWLGNNGGTPQFSIGNSAGNKLTWNGTALAITGSITATTGAIGGLTIGTTKVYVGVGNFNNADTAFYVDNTGQFSLKNQLSWNGTTLSVSGYIAVSGAAADVNANVTTISGSKITTNTITTDHLQASSVTASKISVTSLSAINADLGTITAGNVTINTAGFIRGGATAFNTGVGFWLGYDTANYKLHIGNPAGNKLVWDGSTLAITGAITLTNTIAYTSVTGGPPSNADVTLTAVNGGLSLTGGGLVLSSGGASIRQGKTSYPDASTTGFFLGDSTGPKFRIGTSSQYLDFNGTSLLFTGSVEIGTGVDKTLINAAGLQTGDPESNSMNLVDGHTIAGFLKSGGITYNTFQMTSSLVTTNGTFLVLFLPSDSNDWIRVHSKISGINKPGIEFSGSINLFKEATSVLRTDSNFRALTYQDSSGNQVVGTRQSAIAGWTAPTDISGAATVDPTTIIQAFVDIDAKFDSILAMLRTHGLIAT